MSKEQKSKPKLAGSMELIERAARGEAIAVERMPQPTIRLRLAMRDCVRLDTQVWLPEGESRPLPAILFRTPYREEVLGWARLGPYRYVEAGYALIFQLVRGTGASEGAFGFNAPHDRTDGFDTIEWIAAQAWCDGNVGMDGGSYLGMTQLTAASARPPHLKCIMPFVPSADFFRETPYLGGIFWRLHAINWTNLISVESMAELDGGFVDTMPIMSKPAWLARMRSRPLVSAADDVLDGDKLQYYKDALAHPTFDQWWRERHILPEDYRRIDIPAFVTSGNFDMSIGALMVWRGLEENAPNAEGRNLLIGPWDHGQSYVGGAKSFGPYEMGEDSIVDMAALRLAFFDRHLRAVGNGPDVGGRVRIFVTGANRWVTGRTFPLEGTTTRSLFLGSGGRANSARGDGLLAAAAPSAGQSPDRMISDPELPIVTALSAADPALKLDIRELERNHDVLVYSTPPLETPLTILGEPTVALHLAVDAPDSDVIAFLAEARADGRTIQLAMGALRLRYREGFDREVPLTPGEPARAMIPLTFVGHRVPAGSRVRLILAPTSFPYFDPNPNTGEPVATATTLRQAEITVFHDCGRASRLELPTSELA